MKKLISFLFRICFLSAIALAQVPVSLMPAACPQFQDTNGNPLAGGKIFTYAAGTTTPQATYTDAVNGVQNSNPIILNSAGYPISSSQICGIWLSLNSYRLVVQNSAGVQQWVADNVSDPGFFYTIKAVLLSPAGNVLQTITGPLAATYFQGTTLHVTSTGIRVSYLDPFTTLDTATNPPSLTTYNPLVAGQNYNIPDPTIPQSSFVLNPGSADWVTATVYAANAIITPGVSTNPCGFSFIALSGLTSGVTRPTFSTLPCIASSATVTDNGGIWTSQGISNQLDCTKTGLTCKRTAYFYLEGGGCNNATAGLGWDTFGTNSPTPFCVTGTNIQKGVLAFPSAATHIQENIGSGAAAGTCTTTYPATTVAGNLLVAEIAVDTSRTVTGVTDGTNAYSLAIAKTNGTLDLEIWYFANTSASKTAGTTLTATFSAAGNCVIEWQEYAGIVTGDSKDKTASNSGTGTAVTTGTTAGTAQAVELVLAAMASPANPTITFQNGWTPHSASYQVANLMDTSEGLIQQSTTTQAASFTLNTSQAWAAAIATFKVSVGAAATAQRQIALPAYYLAATPVNVGMKWQAPQVVAGTVDVALGAQIVCTADGSTDDPAFNTAVTATPAVSATGAVIVTTPFNALTSTGCAPSNLMHLQIERLRYNALDNYEGWVYVDGASLQFGITQ